nr:hypothetical protein [uncultured Dongia sp.]
MTRKNPFVRMNWIENYPHLIHHDVAVLQNEMKKLYPTLVMFPRAHHFHELGAEPRRPELIHNMVEHFTPRVGPKGGYISGQALAVRVPWPEDIATGNPQRLIGRPHRRPFDDSKEAFRRFGRTVYFHQVHSVSMMLFCGITIQPPPALLAMIGGIKSEDMPPFRYLACLGGFHVEMPHDTEDLEVVAFVKSVSSIINRLTTRTSCAYDGFTGEPLITYSHQPISRYFAKLCASERYLYRSINGVYQGHLCLSGPTPAQRWKWRRELGLSPGPKPAALSIPKLRPHEMLKWTRANLVAVPNDFHVEENKLANRAMYEYVAARTPGFVMPADPVIPKILPETDIWTEQQRQARESLRRYAEIGEAAFVSAEQLEQRKAALRRKPSRRAKQPSDAK